MIWLIDILYKSVIICPANNNNNNGIDYDYDDDELEKTQMNDNDNISHLNDDNRLDNNNKIAYSHNDFNDDDVWSFLRQQ